MILCHVTLSLQKLIRLVARAECLLASSVPPQGREQGAAAGGPGQK